MEVLRARAGTPPTAKLDGLPKAKATASRTEISAVKISDAERELERLREEETETILNLAIRISERVKATKGGITLKNPFEDLPDFSEMAEQGNAMLKAYMGDFSELLPQDDKRGKRVEEPKDLKESDDPNSGKHVQVKTTVNRHHMRRVSSELALEKVLDWHFEQGNSYHVISHGDVDALTYLRCILKQQRIRFALVSTWCMASEDISEIRSWIKRGYIGRCDFYVGEIFKASYFKQYEELIALCKKFGGRVAICRNHSKVILAFGERFDAVVESSANVNHNPRIEQACITVDTELAQWYKDFFDGIISFERNFDDVQPWRPQADS